MLPNMASLTIVIVLLAGAYADAINLIGNETNDVVDAHNKYRIEANATAMQKLKWNNALEQFAQNTASKCKFDHTTYETRQNVAGFSYIGENIYTVAGAMAQPTVKSAVDDWASEQKDYDLNSDKCSKMCGHYTQIVWAATTDFGCAISQCDGIEGFSSEKGYLIFCNYGIGGNMVGEKPFEKASGSGDVGSKCKATFNNTADGSGLCS